ncbi:major facilitator superfamily domain-containing protein [Diaporthe sp. PMI_573]|nr:major facilitator superfamily domain-containing protein [Diaporthaceae sp. PMI_573]
MTSTGKVPPGGLASEDSDPASATPERDLADRAVDDNNATDNDPQHTTVSSFKPDWRFWLIYVSLCLVTFASAVDNTIVFTALPTITRALGGGSQYVWIANSYVIASTAIQPLCGQLSNVLGRRGPSLFFVALFALGSGIAGGANGVGMLIAGRTIQGIGCGGIFVLLDIIVCDLVPLRERGKYLGPMLAAGGLGSALGPLIGGALTEASWRWVFYITLPFSGLTLVTMVAFLRLHHVRDASWKQSLVRVDLPGNLLFIASITAVLLGLIMGGKDYPWASWHIILPLVLGFVGWVLFHVYQMSPWCKEPSIPPWLFANRTSAVGFILSFLSGVLLEWVVYWYPLYFQALLGKSPLMSGVDTLPFNVLLMPAAMVSGILMSKTGTYRPLHVAAYVLLSLGLGLSSMLDATSSTAEWAIFQIILALGLGCTFVTLLPAIQAALPESDVATATATYSFFRSFGFIWGVTIPSLILDNHINNGLSSVDDADVRDQLAGGGAYQFAAYGGVQALPDGVRQQVTALYSGTFKTTWLAALAFSLLGFLLVFVEKHVEMRKELDTEFGMEEKKKTETTESAENVVDEPKK